MNIKKVFAYVFTLAAFSLAGLIFGTDNVAYAKSMSDTTSQKITKITESQYNKNMKSTKRVNVNKVYTMFKAKKTFYLYVGYKECPYCRKFSSTLNKFSQKKRVFYFDMDQKINKKLAPKVKYVLYNKLKLKTTPSVYYVKNGVVHKKVSNSKATLKDLYNLNK